MITVALAFSSFLLCKKKKKNTVEYIDIEIIFYILA